MANPIVPKKSSTSNAVPLTTDLELGEIAVNDFDGKMYLKTNDGTEDVVQVGADKMNWRGDYLEVEYHKNDVTKDGVWTMVANTTTTDRAAPQPVGNPKWGIDPTEDFNSAQYTGIVTVRQSYIVNTGGWIQLLQVRMPNWTIDTTTVKITVEIGSQVTVISNPILSNDDIWVNVSIGEHVVSSGTTISVVMDMYHQNDAGRISGGWNSNIGTGVPASQGFNISSADAAGTMTIDHTDLAGNLRETELRGVQVGSIITLTETGDAARSSTFEATSTDTTNTELYSTYTYNFIDTGSKGGVRSSRTTNVKIDVPITTATDYTRLVDGYLTPPSWATVTTELSFDGVVQPDTNDAYGINFLYQPGEISPDWDVLATSATGAGASPGGDGVGEAPSDGTPYVRQNTGWVSGKTTLTSLDNVNASSPVSGDRLAWDQNSLSWVPKRSQSALGFAEFPYRWTTAPNSLPSTGDISTNNIDPTLVTIVYIHKVDQSSSDITLFLENLDAGDWLNAHLDDDTDTAYQYDVIGDPLLNGDVFEVPVVYFNHNGTLTNNASLNVFVRYVNDAEAGIPEAPIDGEVYGREDATWVPVATGAQGDLADTSIQPGDNNSVLTNNAGYITELADDTSPTLSGDLDLATQGLLSDGQVVLTSDNNAGFALVPGNASDNSILEFKDSSGTTKTEITQYGSIDECIIRAQVGDLSLSAPSGALRLAGIKYPNSLGGSGQILMNNGLSEVVWTLPDWISELEDDPSPRLGGNLNLGGNDLDAGTEVKINFSSAGVLSLVPGSVSSNTSIGFDNATGSLRARMQFTQSTGNVNLDSYYGDLILSSGSSRNVIIDGQEFPNTFGSADQVLTTDGAGNLSWETPSGGGGGFDGTMTSDLNMNGYNITDGTGNVKFAENKNIELYVNNNGQTRLQFKNNQIGNQQAEMSLRNGICEFATDEVVFKLDVYGSGQGIEIGTQSGCPVDINYARWPSSDGANGRQLTTNGSGSLSWGSALVAVANEFDTVEGDVLKQKIRDLVIEKNVTVAPTSPDVGDQYYNATLNKPLWWSGTSWLDSQGN